MAPFGLSRPLWVKSLSWLISWISSTQARNGCCQASKCPSSNIKIKSTSHSRVTNGFRNLNSTLTQFFRLTLFFLVWRWDLSSILTIWREGSSQILDSRLNQESIFMIALDWKRPVVITNTMKRTRFPWTRTLYLSLMVRWKTISMLTVIPSREGMITQRVWLKKWASS